jgi:hypothetical protein
MSKRKEPTNGGKPTGTTNQGDEAAIATGTAGVLVQGGDASKPATSAAATSKAGKGKGKRKGPKSTTSGGNVIAFPTDPQIIEDLKSGRASMFDPDRLKSLAELTPGEYDRVRRGLKNAGIPRLHQLDKEVDKLRRLSEPREKKEAIADKLFKVAQEEADYFQESDGTTYARATVNETRQTLRVRSRAYRKWLIARYRKESGRVPSDTVLRDVINAVEADASETKKERVFLRVGAYKGRMYIDLCNDEWEFVEITGNGWNVIKATDLPEHVHFRRSEGMLPLPKPQEGGSLAQLRPFLNVRPDGAKPNINDSHFVLFVMMLVNSFRYGVPYVVTSIEGEEGTGKSATIENARSLVDPATVTQKPWPKDEHNLYVSTERNHVMAFDNVSKMPADLSDALCRLATGGGFGTRKLYEDDEERLFRATRPVWISGINTVIWRPDLIDRAIFLSLEPIKHRRTAAEFAEAFQKIRPQVFGLLCSIAAHGLKNLPEIESDKDMPRMADFDTFSRACETYAWDPGTFRKAYFENRHSFKANIIKYDSVANAISDFMTFIDDWQGTASELYEALDEIYTKSLGQDHSDNIWPAAPNALTRRLRVIAPIMRQVRGIDIRTGRDNSAREVLITRKTR